MLTTYGSIAYGDLPTWISAIGGILAFIVLWRTLVINNKQLRLQEKQIKKLQASEKDRILREHATKISIWPEPSLKNPTINLINTSNSPVTNLVLVARKTGSERPQPVAGSDGVPYGIRVLPKGDHKQALPESTYELENDLALYFCDQAEVFWRRDTRGALKQVKKEDIPEVKRWLDKPNG